MGELTPNLLDLDRFAVPVERVEKPWGYEIVYAATDRYSARCSSSARASSSASSSTSARTRSSTSTPGRIELEVGEPGRTPDIEVVGPGRAFRFAPGVVHRWRALEDSTVLEASTPELDDVVRLEDRYGRADA